MTVAVDSCFSGGENSWPPGFRFHPTDEELVLYYLKRKICKKSLKLDIIRELDVYKWDPEDLPGQSILKTGDRQWFFFTPRDRKYLNGARSNRASRQGFWKATGKDRIIMCNSRSVGVKKTLVFYRGRAPHGERTDWVMHEYTLDEAELMRCSNVQDYYALYKVYKKSGPGPKNGEQYGALFKEEEWAKDDEVEFNNAVMLQDLVKQNQATAVDNTKIVAEVQPPLSNSEDFMRQIVEGDLLDEPAGYTYAPLQVAAEEEAKSTLVDPSLREVIFHESFRMSSEGCQQRDGKQANFDFQQSATSKLQLLDAAEISSCANISPWSPHLREDFLEIDDLLGPEPVPSSTEKIVDSSAFTEFDGLSDLVLDDDAALLLHNLGVVDQETVLHQHINHPGNNPVNQIAYQEQQHSFPNQVGCQLLPNMLADQVDFPLLPLPELSVADYELPLQSLSGVNVADSLQIESCDANFVTNQWLPEQRSNAFMSSGPIQGPPSQKTPGVSPEPSNNRTGANIKDSGKEDDGATGWLRSTLWSLVESVPTTPASAAESPLVNKAFERMSSLRVRMNVKNVNPDTCNVPVAVRSSSRNKGFIFLSMFGAVCAVLWALVGTLRVLGRNKGFIW
ncbi:hypothetical protein K2173_015226 [Erythroxylum novogranatense]|uniref:NAC domain-containing protein n=1 Tax=Erythroxylum novogranatense TaxID=1862640 RepID=A0AAV8T361_9ROSI|nr:hypothetical protein K2173_015226 [Erythroxylum novogranatense]